MDENSTLVTRHSTLKKLLPFLFDNDGFLATTNGAARCKNATCHTDHADDGRLKAVCGGADQVRQAVERAGHVVRGGGGVHRHFLNVAKRRGDGGNDFLRQLVFDLKQDADNDNAQQNCDERGENLDDVSNANGNDNPVWNVFHKSSFKKRAEFTRKRERLKFCNFGAARRRDLPCFYCSFKSPILSQRIHSLTTAGTLRGRNR